MGNGNSESTVLWKPSATKTDVFFTLCENSLSYTGFWQQFDFFVVEYMQFFVPFHGQLYAQNVKKKNEGFRYKIKRKYKVLPEKRFQNEAGISRSKKLCDLNINVKM